MRHCYIIAEAGSCHDGSLDRALELVQIAKDAGANAVKFQFWSDSVLLALARHDSKLATFYEPYRMPYFWLGKLQYKTNEAGMDFMCTVYLEQDIATIAPYIEKFKIASPDALNHKFIEAHKPYKKPIIISVGMLTADELNGLPRRLVGMLTADELNGLPRRLVGYLHCVSAYPCPLDQLNLGAMRMYDFDGFSDHSGDVRVGAWAFCAGANILEVHFKTLETPMTNPDYPHAFNPNDLKVYIDNVRQAEQAYGDGIKRTMPAEAGTRKYMA